MTYRVSTPGFVPTPSFQSILGRAEPLHALLDYDGTLVPFAPTPEMARPDEHLRDLLRAFAMRADTEVEIVSGRDRDTLGAWLGDLPIALRAEHGMWLRRPGEREWTACCTLDQSAVAAATRALEAVALAHGGRVEPKRSGAAWHYRGLDIAGELVTSIAADLDAQARAIDFEVLRGACVLELRARGVHKGSAVRAAVEARPDARIFAIGDDVTDEDMFRHLREPDIGVLVGAHDRETAARMRVADVAAARLLIASLARSTV